MSKHELCSLAHFKYKDKCKMGYIIAIRYDENEEEILYTIITTTKTLVVRESEIIKSRVSALDYVNKIIKKNKENKIL